jgi:hypothetical protein
MKGRRSVSLPFYPMPLAWNEATPPGCPARKQDWIVANQWFTYLDNDYDRDKYDLEEDKYRAEGYVDRKFNDGIEDVEDAPENAARWTGREEQRVEDIPQDIDNDWDRAKYGVENRFDNDVDRVEDAPERVAGWFGRKDGDVERFDDNVDNAYDEGKYEGRNEDGWWWMASGVCRADERWRWYCDDLHMLGCEMSDSEDLDRSDSFHGNLDEFTISG